MSFARAEPFNDLRFEMLRAKLESALTAPAVIGITAAQATDGKDAAVRGLANSLAFAGYSTLLLDARVTPNSRAYAAKGLTLEESGRLMNGNPTPGKLYFLAMNDLFVQQTTSKRHVEVALNALKTKFDFIVVNLDLGLTTAFAESMVQTVDAVFVCVQKERRGSPADMDLAITLDRIDDRFVGLITLDAEAANFSTAQPGRTAEVDDWHPLVPATVDASRERREIVQWPT